MAQRFGEYLVQQRLLKEDQLAHALERQVTVGGRLGTNLVELGFLSDLELTRALSRHLNMAPAQPDVFNEIPSDVVRLLTPELAQRHGAVPFQKEGRRTLCVAMADPSELAALDELKFAAGCDIKPFLAPEAKIEWALEKYYGLTRPLRHVAILGAAAGMTLFNEHGQLDAESAEQTLPTVEKFEHGLKLAYDELLHVKHRDEVVAVLLRESSRVADRALFFAIAEGRAIGLMGRGGGAMEDFLGLEIKLEESPLLRHAVEKQEAAVQPYSPDASGAVLAGLLKSAPPRQIAAFPLMAAGHAVGVLYADTQQPGSFPCVGLLQKFAAKGGMAMDMLILRKKILEL